MPTTGDGSTAAAPGATDLLWTQDGPALLAIARTADGTPIDLFPDRRDRADPTGAILRGRVARRFDGGAGEVTVPAGIAADGRVRVDRLPAGVKPGAAVTVQIVAAPPGDKRPSATALPTLVGRTVALQPLAPAGVTLSRRLSEAPAAAALAQALAPPAQGRLVVRQAALDHPAEAVAAEAAGLIAAASAMAAAGDNPAVLVPAPPVWRRLAVAQSGIRTLIVDAAEGKDRGRGVTADLAAQPIPGLAVTAGDGLPLDWLDAHLAPTVPLPQGGRLTIETTQALTAIDVDTGDGTAATVNAAAATAVAREIRLRNLSGLIVVDFAGHAGRTAADALIARLAAGLDGGPAETTPGRRFSPLGLWECARQRRAPALSEIL